jgi:hypothetical protein
LSDLKRASYSPYSVRQNAEYVPELIGKPFPGMGALRTDPVGVAGVEQQMPSDYDNQDGNNRATTSTVDQFRSNSEYSIWQQHSYMGSYQIPASFSVANLPSNPFPGMGPKLFNPTVVHPSDSGNQEDANQPPVDQFRGIDIQRWLHAYMHNEFQLWRSL